MAKNIMENKYLMDDPINGGKTEVLGYSEVFGRDIIPKRGKTRDVYDTNNGELLIVATDRISAFDVIYPTLIPYKGKSLTDLSEYWFKKTGHIIPNHFIEKADERTIRVFKADRIDIEWIMRGYNYGSLNREYQKGRREFGSIKLPNNLQLAEELPESILTPTTKADVGHDEEITKEQAIEKRLCTREQWDMAEETSHILFDFYRQEANRRGLIIPDFKLEFGTLHGDIIQIDEPPTHDSARLWAKKYYEIGKKQEPWCLDKEYMREFSRRMGFEGNGKMPPIISELPKPVIREISKRCVGSNEVLINGKNIDDMNLKSVEEVIEELKREGYSF